MEKRVVVFIVLSLAVILGWNYFLESMGLAPLPPQSEESDVLDSSESSRGTFETGERIPSESSAFREPSFGEMNGMEKRQTVAPLDETIEVVTDLYRAELTNKGGVIKSWELRGYSSPTPEGPDPIQLMYGEGQFKGPLSLKTSDETLTRQLGEALYHVEQDFTRLDETNPEGQLTFNYQDTETGLVVQKTLTFHHDSYVVDVRVTTEGMTGFFEVGLGTNFGIVEWGEGFIGLVGPAFLVDEKLEKDTPEEGLERRGEVRWVALQDKYFMSVLIPREADTVVIQKEGDKLVSAGVRFEGTQSAVLQLYAGPKQYDILTSFNERLEDTIDFGWFIYGSWDIVRAVAKPLFYVLRFFNRYVDNYGISIILLTICIKLLFVPLQYKSYKSMKDMQVVQPKVAELQKKLKDDRERLNRELIKLYRDHKVNPVGGCLPMLLQMPVFIALFNILYMTIDLRQAPFLLWISDLSVPDPFFVLPVLMGASMVLQQKIMPTTMDPTQAKMMLMLPVFLTFIFLNFASGLVLYWLTNNVLTITQQFVTDRYIFKRPMFSSLTGNFSQPSSEPENGKQPKGPDKDPRTQVARGSDGSTEGETKSGGSQGQKKTGRNKKKSRKVSGSSVTKTDGKNPNHGDGAGRPVGSAAILAESSEMPLGNDSGVRDDAEPEQNPDALLRDEEPGSREVKDSNDKGTMFEQNSIAPSNPKPASSGVDTPTSSFPGDVKEITGRADEVQVVQDGEQGKSGES